MSGIIQSNEFFINIKPKDIPKWNNKLSYFEQDLDTIVFYENELKKIREGITINGVFIHPWLYWHVNFFKARITQKDGSEPIINPYLDDHAWYFAENYKEAEEQEKGVCMFGTRGFSKTVLESSVALWTAVTRFNGIININGGSSKDLKDVCQGIKLGNENLESFLKLPILTEDWDKDVMFGIRETNSTIFQSRLDILNLEEGKGKASEKAAGGTPAGWLADEIGKFDPRALLDASKPKFYSQYGAKLVHILSGTGGNSELSEGAKIVLENPDDYKLIRMNWDRLDNSIPEEAITWKETRGTTFCTFVPGQMSYRIPVPKIEKTLDVFTGNIGKNWLKKIKIFQTDWINATKHLKKEIDLLSTDDAKNKQRMYHPMETTDCFLIDSPNPFNVSRLTIKLNEIKNDPKYRLVELYSDVDGKVQHRLSEKKLAEREYKNKDIDAPIMLFEDRDTEAGEYYYTSGIDDYKLTNAKESTSLGTIYVLKRRNVEVNSPIEKMVLAYASRPHQSHNILYDNFRLSLKKFNCLANIEAIDVGFANYLETLGFNMMDYLTDNLNPSNDLTSTKKTKSNSRYGTYPTPGNVKLMFDTVLEYTNEPVTVGWIGEEPLIKYGCDFIEDPYLIEEMINYKSGGNFDRIVAFGWALLYARFLDKKNIKPKRNKIYSDSYYEKGYEDKWNNRKKINIGFNNFARTNYQNF